MKKYWLCCLLVWTSVNFTNAQSTLEEWEGIYEGEMVIGFTERPNDSLHVRFEMLPLEKEASWTYKMIYNSKRYGEIIKDYIIYQDGEGDKNFILDEKDGILIEMSLMNNCFYEMFEVMEQLFATTLCKDGDNLRFDLAVSLKKKKRVSTTEPEGDEDPIEVISYKPTQHQTVVLHRIDVE